MMPSTTLPKRKRVCNRASLQSASITNASAGQAAAAQLMCWLDSDYDKTRLRTFSPR